MGNDSQLLVIYREYRSLLKGDEDGCGKPGERNMGGTSVANGNWDLLLSQGPSQE